MDSGIPLNPMREKTDDELLKGLRGADEIAWTELRAAGEALEQARAARGDELVRWEGGDEVATAVVDGEERPVFSMPYAVYDEVIDRARAALGGVGAVQVFDWMSWPDLERYARGGDELDGATAADAVRLATAAIRSDRFNEGSFGAAVENGAVTAIIRRLLRWYDSERPS